MTKQIIKKLLGGAILVTLLASLTQTASARPAPLNAPDAGSASLFVGVACAGLAAVRRRMR